MLVKRVTLHVRLVFPLLRRILVQGVVTALVVLMDVFKNKNSIVVLLHVSLVVMIISEIIFNVFNVKETDFMLSMVLVKVNAYPKPNALKTI